MCWKEYCWAVAWFHAVSSLQNLVKLAGQEWRRPVPPRAAGTNTSTQRSIIRTWWEKQIPQEEDVWWVWTYLVTVLRPPGHRHLFVQLIVDCQKCLIHIQYFVLMMRVLSWSRRQFADFIISIHKSIYRKYGKRCYSLQHYLTTLSLKSSDHWTYVMNIDTLTNQQHCLLHKSSAITWKLRQPHANNHGVYVKEIIPWRRCFF